LIFPPSPPVLDSFAPDEAEPRSDWLPPEVEDVCPEAPDEPEPAALEELDPPALNPPTVVAGP